MSKKVYVPILIAIVAALAAGLWNPTAAFAKGDVKRSAGVVKAVNASAGTFTIHARRLGKDVTFSVNANTQFHSKDNQVKGLADLKDGMYVIVHSGQPSGNGDPVARRVAVVNRTKKTGKSGATGQSQIDNHFLGKIEVVNGNSLTIRTHKGQQISVQLTAETRYRSRGESLSGQKDLKAGMIVMVGVKDLGNGMYQALFVAGRAGGA